MLIIKNILEKTVSWEPLYLRRGRKLSCTLWTCGRILCIAWTGLKIRQRFLSELARHKQCCFRILGIRFERWEVFAVSVLLCLLRQQTVADYAGSLCRFWVQLSWMIPSFCIRISDRQASRKLLCRSSVFWIQDENRISDRIPWFATPLSVLDSLCVVSFKLFLISRL